MKIIDTFQINDKNTKTVDIKGEAKMVASIRLYPLDIYLGGIWLPKNIQMGDVVTVFIDQIEISEEGQYTNYNAKFAKVSKELFLSPRDNQQAAQSQPDPFAGGQDMNVSDDDLPF